MSEPKPWVWSFSALETFKNCPKQFYHKYVLKEREAQTKEQIYGTNVHTAFEERLRDGKPLPEHLQKHEDIAASIARNNPEIELEFGLDNSFKPTGYYSPETRGRGKIDVLVRRGAAAWIGDWKTGKEREKEDQVRTYAFFAFMHYPDLKRVVAQYIWLVPNKLGRQWIFERDKIRDYAIEIMKPLMQIDHATKEGHFPPSPSGLCGWCPVTSCPHHKVRHG